MANATETTERAAVWNPPRIRKLNLHAAGSGTLTTPGTDSRYEGGSTIPGDRSTNIRYRMPNSGEVVTDPNPWQ